MGPWKFTMARPISAPYSSCRCRIESGDPSKPDRLARTTTGRLPLAALMARAVFFEERGNSVPAVQMSGPSLGGNPRRGWGLDSIPINDTGNPPRWASKTTEVSASAMPAHRSSTSWSWSVTARILVRIGADVAIHRVTGIGPSGCALSRHDVGVVVVREQHLAGTGQVGRPVLGLTVRTHDTVVATDAKVVLGRDPAREVERLLAGQHHCAVRRHHEDSLGMHQHRGFSVPVRLGPDVDPGHDDVDLAAPLGEGHDAAQRLGDPVHVLGA